MKDYFKRFEWAIKPIKIPEIQYVSYAYVQVSADLNNVLKFLTNPHLPETIVYKQIKMNTY